MFRGDVEGLRALAVFAVLLFHFDFDLFPGGFVGVDIFFVISGYVISKGIASRVQGDAFRYSDFYSRRFRRILPAQAATIVFVLIAGFLFLSVDAYKELGLSSLYAAASLSNFYFAANTGYFVAPAIQKPLLHMWSLSVEEQFYLIWPLLFVTILRRVGSGWRLTVLSALTVLFVALSEAWVSWDMNYAFYMAPSRFFEFLLGAWVAVAERKFTFKRTYISSTLFLVGLSVCIATILLYHQRIRFPGISALLPAVAVAMMILGGANSKLSLIFSNSVARFFGKISYSLYLVHWPLVVFYKHLYGYVLALSDKLGLLGVSVVLAWLMWKFIEQPFRKKPGNPGEEPDRAFYIGLAGTFSAVMVAAFFIYSSGGLEWRLDDKSEQAYRGYTAELSKGRLCKSEPGVPVGMGCFGDPTKNPARALLIGDSHVNNFLYGLSGLLSEAGMRGNFKSLPGCPPILGATVIREPLHYWAPRCNLNNKVYFRLAMDKQYDIVFLAARWALYTNVTQISVTGSKEQFYLGLGLDDERSLKHSKIVFSKKMESTVKELVDTGKKVVIFGQVPDIGFDVKRCLFMPNYFDLSIYGCSHFSTREALENIAFTNGVLSQIANQYPGKVLFLDTSLALCNPDCKYLDGDLPLYVDSNHLAYSGSKLVVQKFSSQISEFIGNEPSVSRM